MEGDPKASNYYTFPPGFRFHPSDEELIVHYLQNKISSRPLPASIIAEINLYKYNPWDLPKKALFGEEEWYFFSPRDRKYPNGLRPNRAAGLGYWKATGTDKPILTSRGSNRIGVKKALVFYSGRPPKGTKTDWIMNEYRLVDTTTKPSRLKDSMRLDDWVLCRVRHKGYSLKNSCDNQDDHCDQNLLSDLPRCEDYTTNTNFQAEMITEYQYKDCHQIMASILVGVGPIPPTESMTSLNFKGSRGNDLASVYEDGFNKENSQMIIPTLDCYLNTTLKRKSNEDYENLISFNSKFSTENKIEGSSRTNNRGLNCYNQNQSQDEIFHETPPEPSITFQELNELAFSGRYPQ